MIVLATPVGGRQRQPEPAPLVAGGCSLPEALTS